MIGYILAALGGILVTVLVGVIIWIRECYRMWTSS